MGVLSQPIGQFALGVLGRRRIAPLVPDRHIAELHDLPLAHLTMETANNEDWVDVLQYHVGASEMQLDIRGIHFEMHLRRSAIDSEIIVGLSTIDRSLMVGVAPNFGSLIFYVPESVMKTKYPGNYVGDVRASKGTGNRICLTVELMLKQGITRI